MEISQGQNKTIAHLVNLKGIVEQVLRENQDRDLRNEFIRMDIADKVHERYANLVKEIATKFLKYEADRRSTISTFDQIVKNSKKI